MLALNYDYLSTKRKVFMATRLVVKLDCESCVYSNECKILNPYKCNSYVPDHGSNYPDNFDTPQIPDIVKSKLKNYSF